MPSRERLWVKLKNKNRQKKKNPNNKQYETALFQNESVLSNSEEGKKFLLS